MKLAVVDYGSPIARQHRALFKPLAIVVAIGIAAYLTRFITFHQISRIDSVTGSVQRQTIWPLGISFAPRPDPSALDVRLTKMGVYWNPNWCFVSDVRYGIFGCCGRGCGRAPAIYQLRPAMKEFVDASTDNELRAFVSVMQSGTDAQRSAAIEAAVDKALKQIGP